MLVFVVFLILSVAGSHGLLPAVGNASSFEASAVRPPFVASSVTSMRSLRYEKVFGQQHWSTCGAAAVATWLTFYFERPTTEADVLRVATDAMIRRGGDPRNGLTLRALRRSLQAFGVDVEGYRVDPRRLPAYFQSGGLPVLAHVTRPTDHYVLIVGMFGDNVVLADPSYGGRSLSLTSFVRRKGFDGVVLIASPDDVTARIVAKHQRDFVDGFAGRRRRLTRPGGPGRW